MTRQETRVFLQEWFCGCGIPTTAVARLRDLLTLHPLYDNRAAFELLVPNDGIQYLLLYTLDHFELTEHGGSVDGAWLTDKGKALLDSLNREADDGYHTLMETSCIHGYSVENELEDCSLCKEHLT